MKQILNRELVLWALGVIQPASSQDIKTFLSSMYTDSGPLPSLRDFELELERMHRFGWIAQVSKKYELFSLTEKGNHRFPRKLRHLRDKSRLVLLHAAKNDRFWESEETVQELSGVSPGEDVSSTTKEVARPSDSAVLPRTRSRSSARKKGRARWPRLLKQLDISVGLKLVSSDPNFSYYSFPTIASINRACLDNGRGTDLGLIGLSLALGISARLISSFMHKPGNHYRQFEIGKRGGGKRVISAPRLFLKTTQSWISDYLLWRLPVHEDCHSYQTGKSIISNSIDHVGQLFVGCLDIHDFFGSIGRIKVESLLVKNGFGRELSYTISRVTTLDDKLPQGAPTSPSISNAVLYDFDVRIAATCKRNGLHYSRYADDMTISGADRASIKGVFDVVQVELSDLGLRLNKDKSRIASQGGQQRVTGVVVNAKPQPPRRLRRRIRAMFHQASLHPDNSKQNINELRGYLSYLKSFPELRESAAVHLYEKVIKKVQSV